MIILRGKHGNDDASVRFVIEKVVQMTDAVRPTPHPPLTRSPFPSEGEGLELQTRQFLPHFKEKAYEVLLNLSGFSFEEKLSLKSD